jgi:lysozyme
MQLLGFLISRLILNEGMKSQPYRCPAGKLTIGVGHNLDAKPIKKADAIQILVSDINDVISELNEKLPWWITSDEPRAIVLIEMSFKLGI